MTPVMLSLYIFNFMHAFPPGLRLGKESHLSVNDNFGLQWSLKSHNHIKMTKMPFVTVCWHAGMVGPVMASGLCPLQTHFVHCVHFVNNCAACLAMHQRPVVAFPEWNTVLSRTARVTRLVTAQHEIRSRWSRCLLWNGIRKFIGLVSGLTALQV